VLLANDAEALFCFAGAGQRKPFCFAAIGSAIDALLRRSDSG
jgi:hypothetical protein